MTKIFNASIHDAKENKKQSAARNNAVSQLESAKEMESLGVQELSNREKVTAWYAKSAELVAFHCMGVSKEVFEAAKEETDGFTKVFTECRDESAQKNGLTDTLTVGSHKFYVKKQDVYDAFDIVRSYESSLKVEKAKQVEARVISRAKEKENTTLAAAAALLGISVEELKAMKK